MATITHKFVVCDDCVQVIANAATSADTGNERTDIAAEGLANNWPGISVVLASNAEDDHETLSPAPCGGCDTATPGGRTPAVVFDA